jgi:type I restriction enzyme S subunit
MSKSRVAERSAAYALQTAVEPAFGTSFDLLATAPQGVGKLRQLILSFAIRGKLVPQNAADGSASSLLKRVHEERMDLAVRGTLKRKTAKPVDHDEEWTGLPESWAWTCLANIGVINPRNDVSDDTEASFVQMSSIPVALMEPHKTERRIWREIKSGFTHFAEGDVGVAKITPCFENGKSTVFRNLDSGVGAGTTELHVVRPLGSISPDYILIFLKSPEFLLPGEKGMTGSAGQKRLSRNYFETRAFPLPPLAEQARIVARVGELMQLCDALEAHGRLQDKQHARLVATLFDALAASAFAEELAENWQRVATHFDLLLDRPEAVDALEQAILQLAVRGLLVPQDESDEPASKLLDRIRAEKGQLVAEGKVGRDMPLPQVADDEAPFVVPAAWQWVRFGALVRKSEAGWSPSCEGGSRRGDAWGVLKVSAVSWGEFRSSENKQLPASLKPRPEYEVQSGDFLISRANTEELVARSVVAKNPEPRLMLSDKIIRLDISSLVDRDFLNMVNNAKTSRTYYAENASGTSSSMKNVGRQVILNLPIPLPPLAEQHRIVARVEQLRRLCADLRERLQQARATQSRLAEALVSAAAESPSC